jgi:tripartite-type tricarboxylate transporter receptor subunit TctC
MLRAAAVSIMTAISIVSAFAPTPVLAQAQWPAHVVKIIIPLAPGGPTDTFGRMYGVYLEQKYHQPFIVENRSGAGQNVGAAYVVQQPDDGYTLLAGSNGLAYESLVNKDTTYNSTKDILPFGAFAGSGMFLQINPSLPVNTFQEFVTWVKANPNKLNLGTASVPLAPFEGMRDRLGLTWTYVNYKGGTPAEQAILANDVQAYFGDSKGVQQAKLGKLKVLAYSGPTRHPDAPNVPTLAELGLSDFNYIIWLGMYARPGVPGDIITRLNADMNDMSRTPEALARYKAIGWLPLYMSVADIHKDTAKMNEQIEGWLAKGLKLR